LEDLDVDERAILKLIIKKQEARIIYMVPDRFK
jgi:hypothetical protein